VLAYGMLSEFAPPTVRGRVFAWVALLASFGLPLALALAYFVLPLALGWRWMLVVPAGLGALVMVLRLQLPESPRWLAARGQARAADEIVTRIEASAHAALAKAQTVVPEHQAPHAAMPWRKLAIASMIHAAAMCAIFGFVAWLPAFFVAAGHSVAASALFAGVMAAGGPVGALISFAITDRVERKWGVVAAALTAATLGGVYAWATAPAMIMGLGFLVVVTLYVFVTLGMFSYVPELFATPIRMRAIGVASLLGRIVGFGIPFGVTAVFAAYGQAGVIAAVALVLAATALVVARWGTATNRRSIENV
jgi:putative MFS transporter